MKKLASVSPSPKDYGKLKSHILPAICIELDFSEEELYSLSQAITGEPGHFHKTNNIKNVLK